jgi:hypothetical protein
MIPVQRKSVAGAADPEAGDATHQIDFPDILIPEIATSINARS